MASGPEMQRALECARHGVGAAVRLLASLKLVVTLVVLLAVAYGCALYLEAANGREWAQWYVYGRVWYIGLLVLLAANIAATSWAHFSRPWGRRGLMLAPVGLLVLLAGCIQTLVQGIEGELILRQGETADTVMQTDRSQLTLLSPRGKEVQSSELGFSPGPADWRGDQSLDFGKVDGTAIKVLRFYRHALYEPGWVTDEAGVGEPAIQVGVADSHGRGSGNRWYVPVLFGLPPKEELYFSIKQASVQSLCDDFLRPPTVQPGSRGILSAHYKDHVYPIRVDGNTGKKVSVGDSALTVEIVEYYANAKSKNDQFSSEGGEPKNPMLKLRVQTPDQKEPVTEIAYANHPFVNYESIKKQKCPIKFWYHHPATTVVAGAEFLQTPEGKLYCRVGDGKAYQPRGQVKQGDQITVSADCKISLLRHIPHARRQGTFAPIEPARGETTTAAEAAALVELTTAGRTEQFWLRRNDAQLGVRKLEGLDRPLVVMFGYERRPLGFSVKLVDLHRDTAPGSSRTASGVSRVQLSAANNPLREISANHPFRSGTLTFYQTGFQQLPNSAELSVLRVTSDPGRLLKYSGGAMICGGILFALALPAFVRLSKRPSLSSAQTAEGSNCPEHQGVQNPAETDVEVA